ncbi:hypothetical protein BKA80DRAFT_282641 [Phyllosticta citrichinensis]
MTTSVQAIRPAPLFPRILSAEGVWICGLVVENPGDVVLAPQRLAACGQKQRIDGQSRVAHFSASSP